MKNLEKETILDMTPLENQSQFVCPGCYVPFGLEDGEQLSWSMSCVCSECGAYVDSYTALIIVLPHYGHLADNPLTARETHWYHVSVVPPESMDFDSNKIMHVGQMDTIMDYKKNKHFSSNDHYIYELKLKDDAIISETLLSDMNSWNDVEKELTHNDDVDAFAYINRYELPGSVSLIASRSIFELVGYEEC